MSSHDDRIEQLEARIERLEEAVEALREAVGHRAEVPAQSIAAEERAPERASREAKSSDSRSSSGPHTSSSSSVLRPDRWDFLPSVRSEDWLNYVGIGLLLFGLAFLFRYTIEQGWLIPQVRVGTGGLTGAVLLGGGLRVYEERRRLRQVLLGGSIATFYGTIFSAYQLYGLLSYPVAFGSMGLVTVGAIVLSLRQDHASMAVIGTMGGLGTPFLLYTDVSGVAGLAVYICVVIAGACAIYLHRGWNAVLYTAVVGGWGVLLVPCIEAAFTGARPDGAWILQGSLVVAWGLFGGIPVLRAVLRQRAFEEWLASTVPEKALDPGDGRHIAFGIVSSSPLVALFASRLLWGGTAGLWAMVAGTGALLYAAGFIALRQWGLLRFASAHGLVAAVMLAYALGKGVGGVALLPAWGVEALLLLVLARRFRDPTLQASGHGLFVLVGAWLGIRWTNPDPDASPIVSATALSELMALATGAVAAAGRHGWERRFYLGVVLAGWLAWWRHEFLLVANGQAYISVAWGLTTAGLLGGGIRWRSSLAQTAGLATLLLFVGKLFLVDLAALPALWRVSLFLGAGGGFLLLSYALPGVGRDVGTRAPSP